MPELPLQASEAFRAFKVGIRTSLEPASMTRSPEILSAPSIRYDQITPEIRKAVGVDEVSKHFADFGKVIEKNDIDTWRKLNDSGTLTNSKNAKNFFDRFKLADAVLACLQKDGGFKAIDGIALKFGMDGADAVTALQVLVCDNYELFLEGYLPDPKAQAEVTQLSETQLFQVNQEPRTFEDPAYWSDQAMQQAVARIAKAPASSQTLAGMSKDRYQLRNFRRGLSEVLTQVGNENLSGIRGNISLAESYANRDEYQNMLVLISENPLILKFKKMPINLYLEPFHEQSGLLHPHHVIEAESCDAQLQVNDNIEVRIGTLEEKGSCILRDDVTVDIGECRGQVELNSITRQGVTSIFVGKVSGEKARVGHFQNVDGIAVIDDLGAVSVDRVRTWKSPSAGSEPNFYSTEGRANANSLRKIPSDEFLNLNTMPAQAAIHFKDRKVAFDGKKDRHAFRVLDGRNTREFVLVKANSIDIPGQSAYSIFEFDEMHNPVFRFAFRDGEFDKRKGEIEVPFDGVVIEN